MSDLIDREALRNALHEAAAVTMKGVEIINTFPAVEPKKGEWIFAESFMLGEFCKCSNCDGIFPYNQQWKINFCPDCGADMRGETNE